MAWLFLLSYWIAAIVIASFFYALWNRGIEPGLRLVGIEQSEEVGPFEGEQLRVELTLDARGRVRGPFHTRLELGGTPIEAGAGLIPKDGYAVEHELPPQRRGPVTLSGWISESGDPLGLFVRRSRKQDSELVLMLPRYASLHARPLTREIEASVTAPRAGSGTEVFGVRQYQPGDALRRIHWRSTARAGELVVREFEPPGVQNLGIFLDPNPPTLDAADQCARLAASEAWDCLRAGGRVTLWAPACEPTRPDEDRNLLALLEWLARYPNRAAQDEPPPIVGDAIAVTATSDVRLLDAVEDVRAHGGSVRAWVVGEAELDSDMDTQRAGLTWPL
ncbi:MAG TPA: DUF58 domain-containing protein [Candidatus Dormibacteraeota bacterium]